MLRYSLGPGVFGDLVGMKSRMLASARGPLLSVSLFFVHVLIAQSAAAPADAVTSSTATLNGGAPPSIVVQPKSLSRYARGMYFFEVVAAGTAPLTYSWFKDGVPVTNGTSRLIVRNNASGADAGEYRVVISNFAGSVTSAPASLVLLGDRPPGPLVSLDGHEPPQPLDDVVTMDASALHALAVRSDGTVKAWSWFPFGSAAAVPPV